MEPVGVIGTVVLFLLAETQLLSHITKRVVERIGLSNAGSETVVVVIECGENDPPTQSAGALEIDDFVLAPPPRRFVALSDGYKTLGGLVMGAILDDWGGASPKISLTQVTPDQLVTLAAPPNAVGLLFASLPSPAASSGGLQLLKIRDYGCVDDCRVIGLY